MASQSNSSDQYQLFPGCTIQNRIPYIEKSARYVFEKLGITVTTNPEFGCCPDPVGVQSADHETWLSLGARNLSLAETEKQSIISLCNGCSETLKAVKFELDHEQEEKKLIQARLDKIGKSYEGTTEVLHFIEFFHENIGLKRIKELVKKPLTGIKIAVHPGCHYSRPSELVHLDDPLEPKFQKDILHTLGATVVEYEEESMCCSAGVARNNEDAAMGMMKRKFESIQYAEADIVAVNCPACFQQLEAGQRFLKRKYDMEVKIPIMYITELMALTFGAEQKELGLQYHMIKPKKFLKAHGYD